MPVHFHPTPDVVATELDDAEAVLLHLKTRRYFSINDTGTRIWQLVKDGVDLDGIARALVAEWVVDEDAAREHAHAFLAELEEEGLVRREET